jgi:hypothetical protein
MYLSVFRGIAENSGIETASGSGGPFAVDGEGIPVNDGGVAILGNGLAG